MRTRTEDDDALRRDTQLLREKIECSTRVAVHAALARIARPWSIPRVLHAQHVHVQKVTERLEQVVREPCTNSQKLVPLVIYYVKIHCIEDF